MQPVISKQRPGEILAVERFKIVDAFPYADESYGNTEGAADIHHHAALGGAVQFGFGTVLANTVVIGYMWLISLKLS